MFTFIVFLIVLSVLVLVHEAGHFFAAKRAGMKVEEFGFGFPPRLWSFRRGGTLFSLNLIPFGGFVRIYGEEGEHRTAPGSFSHAPFRWQFAVIVAGVLMNFLLAVVLLMVSNFGGLRVGLFDDDMRARATSQKVQILQVASDSPAQRGGVRPLDEIIGFREGAGDYVLTFTAEDVQTYAYAHAGEDVVMVLQRGDAVIDTPLTLREPQGPGQGPIGISLALTGVIRYPWYESIWRGFVDAVRLFVATIIGYGTLIASIFTDGRSMTDVSGPIGIATLTGQAARVGLTYLLQFMAMISVNLAVLNILPFPALDGGRAVIVLAERIRGRALAESTERAINGIGFAVLLALMVAVTVKDIVQFF